MELLARSLEQHQFLFLLLPCLPLHSSPSLLLPQRPCFCHPNSPFLIFIGHFLHHPPQQLPEPSFFYLQDFSTSHTANLLLQIQVRVSLDSLDMTCSLISGWFLQFPVSLFSLCHSVATCLGTVGLSSLSCCSKLTVRAGWVCNSNGH